MVRVTGAGREPVPSGVLARMTDSLAHRGPDERGFALLPGAALGVRRLAIVDVAEGHQPVWNEDESVVAVQNGELYNHLDLRRSELAGHSFASRCDSEVLPHLYERFGTAFVERLRGKFGLAVWDTERRRLVLARDRLGVKPLYYALAGDCLVFGSELKSVLASGLVSTTLDYEALDAYLSFGFVPGPATPLAAVRKLGAGERLVVESGAVSVERYWHYPAAEPDTPARNEGEYAHELLELLDEAVRLRLMSDVPLGAMLSGGLDSSLVVALMARHASGPVRTFSVGFREAGAGNELAEARLVAERFGCEHHELELSYAEQAVDLAELVWALDEPLADLGALGLLALSQLASQHVTVALSGQGADELFGGYERHRTAALASPLRRLPRPARVATARLASGSRFGRAARVVAADGAAAEWIAAHDRLDDRSRARLVRGPLAELDGGRSAIAGVSNGTGGGLPGLLTLDAQLGLVDDMLQYFDRASMAHSLEVRVPFLDHHLVEWAARLPSQFKVRGSQTKVLLKRAARGIVPDEIIDKPKIGFFNVASNDWLRRQLGGPIPEYLLDPGARINELVDRREVERMVARGAGGRGDGGVLLALLMLEVWLSTYLPRASQLAADPVEAVA